MVVVVGVVGVVVAVAVVGVGVGVAAAAGIGEVFYCCWSFAKMPSPFQLLVAVDVGGFVGVAALGYAALGGAVVGLAAAVVAAAAAAVVAAAGIRYSVDSSRAWLAEKRLGSSPGRGRG